MAEISVVERGVMSALTQQPLVTALFDDGTVVHDDDAVGGLDRG